MTPEPSMVIDGLGVDPASEAGPVADPSIGEPEAPAPDNGSLNLLLGFAGFFLALGIFRSWWIPGIIVGLLFMLFMHELGHYVAARASGMKVTEFFLGFGPKIWSIDRGETEYGIKAIPAGAYVRIIGMTNLDEIGPDDEPRTYRDQPYWQRMITICAGSAMHFAMAIAALVVLFAAYGYTGFHGPPWQVDHVVAGSTAETIGIEIGDRIVSFDGETFNTWTEFGEIVATTPAGPIAIQVDRGGEVLALAGELGARSGDVLSIGFGLVINPGTGFDDDGSWSVESVRPRSNGAEFGLAGNDLIISAGDIEHPTQLELARLLDERDGEILDLVVRRSDNSLVTLDGTVSLDRSQPYRGFLGVAGVSVEPDEPGWVGSLGLAIEDFVVVARTNLAGLADVLNPLNYIGGSDDTALADRPAGASPTTPAPAAPTDQGASRPVSVIGIARLFAESESVDQVLYLFMVVNIFIGLFNLVPLLPLDGGHAALASYEKIRQLVGRDRSYRVDAARLIPLTWVVIALLVGIGMWAALLDIFAWPT